MAVHEQCVGATDEWYTPKHVFDALGCVFDLDPCHPPRLIPWIPVRQTLCARENGLMMPWKGLVWMNPPFGGRNGIVPWLDKFVLHGNGIALAPDRTSAPWWQKYAPYMEALLFVSPKIQFLRPDGSPGTSPGQGTTLFALGDVAKEALRRAQDNGLGVMMMPFGRPCG